MSQQKIPVVDVTSDPGVSARTPALRNNSGSAEIWDPDETVTTDDAVGTITLAVQ